MTNSPTEMTAQDSLDMVELDVIGVGFGPANMALAAALSEHGFRGASVLAEAEVPTSQPTALFLDASSETSWHAGMLFEHATLQVSFAKDLVSFRNPTSPLSFMNFLVETGRVHDFFNRGSMAPLRIEFTAYLRWAAQRLRPYVAYGERVVRVTPRVEDDCIVGYVVESRMAGGESLTRHARHVVLAAGLQPQLPEGFPDDRRAFHSAQFLHRVGEMENVGTAVVLGGGQSAVEVALETHRRFPQAVVHLVHSRFGLIPSDATPFANRIFDNSSVDMLYDAPAAVRERLDRVHANTNNSVVHESTLQELYDAWYVGSWTQQRLVIHDATRLETIERTTADEPMTVSLTHELDGSRAVIAADLVVAGTGYRPCDPGTFLGEGAKWLVRDSAGRVRANRDYSLKWSVPTTGQLFAVGVTQHQHGISTTLLSNIALRAGEIANALTPSRVMENA